MKSVNIFEQSWLDIVFEGKNRAYGAYQLRHENSKTTALAFIYGLLLLTAAVGIPALITKISSQETILPLVNELDRVVNVSNFDPPKPDLPKTTVAAATTDIENKDQLVNPEIVKPQDSNQNIAANTENQPSAPENNNEGGTTVTNTLPTSTGGSGTNAGSDGGTGIKNTTSLDKLPEYPGGIQNFYTYVGRNFEKPELDEQKTIRVYVAFVIEKDGSMTDIHVSRDPGYGMAKEAIRVLRSLKIKWTPGIIDGQPVRTAYSLPITVKIE